MELAKQLRVDPDTAQRWRKSYIDRGIEKLLVFKRTSNIKPLIDEHLKSSYRGHLYA